MIDDSLKHRSKREAIVAAEGRRKADDRDSVRDGWWLELCIGMNNGWVKI